MILLDIVFWFFRLHLGGSPGLSGLVILVLWTLPIGLNVRFVGVRLRSASRTPMLLLAHHTRGIRVPAMSDFVDCSWFCVCHWMNPPLLQSLRFALSNKHFYWYLCIFGLGKQIWIYRIRACFLLMTWLPLPWFWRHDCKCVLSWSVRKSRVLEGSFASPLNTILLRNARPSQKGTLQLRLCVAYEAYCVVSYLAVCPCAKLCTKGSSCL